MSHPPPMIHLLPELSRDDDGEHSTNRALHGDTTASNKYRDLCGQCDCRVNSAVVRYLSVCSEDKPLTELSLQNFYVGPKGIAPLVQLIQWSQTIERVDLRGNGLNNQSIALLCSALEKHLGVTYVYLGDNPITVEGGKYLVQLLEHNRRILQLDVSDTDIYESIRRRLDMMLEDNRHAAGSDVMLIPSKPLLSTQPTPQRASSARTHTAAPELSFVAERSVCESSIFGKTPRASSGTTKRRPSPPNKLPLEDAATATAPKPRPPPPALASREASRLTEKQRQELLTKYQERASLYQQVVKSDASRAADRAREELMLMEQRRTVDAARADGGSRPGTGQRHSPVMNRSPKKSDSPKKSLIPSSLGREASMDTQAGASVNARWSVSDLPPNDGVADDTTEIVGGRRGTLPTPGTDPTVAPSAPSSATSVVPAHAKAAGSQLQLQPLALSRDEQFRELFQKGCQLYQDKQLDAAYLTWNEAMDVAVTSKNREWMSVIANNLQRLSYEILVSEGVKHLESHRLEEADRSFQLALDVANKAKNAAWEGEMQRARKNVQHAVFQRSHESALRLFERAQAVRDMKTTADDRFTMPGDTELREYTNEFVNEWTRMLLIKEAMEMWADASMILRRIGGSSAKVLQEVVSAGVAAVCSFLARKYYVPEPNGNILSLQRTSKFSYNEGIKLIELWTDVVSKTQTALSNRVWDAVSASELGCLYLATHQLPQALNQFEKLVDLGAEVGDRLLSAIGHSYLGILHWHRSNFAVSEKAFLIALEHWKTLRSQQTNPSPNDTRVNSINPLGRTTTDHNAATTFININTPDDGALMSNSTDAAAEYTTHSNSEAPQGSGGPDLVASTSFEYLNVMLQKCYAYLIRLLFVTSRYRDSLEMLERGLLHKYKDRLHEKMLHNFSSKPSLDHITAVASALNSPLVYYETYYRFDWDVREERYTVSQQLMVWVVPKGSEMKVVRVDVTNDFGVESIDTLITTLRKSLCVEPVQNAGVLDSMVSTLPEHAWVEPLQKLYEILMYPISDFLHSHNELANSKGGLITIIPSSSLWLVPFNALLMRNGKYLVEEYSIQVAFCAVQLAFGALCAKRVTDRGYQGHVVIAPPESSADLPLTRAIAENRIPFPLDAVRSTKEGHRIADVFCGRSRPLDTAAGARSPTSGSKSDAAANPTSVSGECEVVEDLNTLRDAIVRARFIHIAATSAAFAENTDGSAGAIIIPASQDEMGLLRSSEVCQYEIASELVVLSATNMAAERVRTTKEGVLGICRSFLAAGVSTVIAGVWCTPDMVPSEIFEPMYQLIMTKRETHKAKAMALALRKLLTDDRYRYDPRFWSGYFSLGVGLS